MDEGSVGEFPSVRMNRVDPTERRKELSGFKLQVERQIGGLHERFFDFNLGFVVVIEFEDNVGETLEVGIDRAVERELDVAGVESALHRIVVADFNAIEMFVARVGEREQSVERSVHVILAAADSNRLGQRSACAGGGNWFRW